MVWGKPLLRGSLFVVSECYFITSGEILSLMYNCCNQLQLWEGRIKTGRVDIMLSIGGHRHQKFCLLCFSTIPSIPLLDHKLGSFRSFANLFQGKVFLAWTHMFAGILQKVFTAVALLRSKVSTFASENKRELIKLVLLLGIAFQ